MDPVSAQARRQPLARAVTGAETRTWAEWDEQIGRAARGLAGLGVSRVALRSQDRLQLATLTLGAIRAGVLAVLIPTRWPAPLASEALEHACVEVAISDLPLVRTRVIPPEALLVDEGQEGGVLDLESLAVAVFTSGSTGRPKAAVLSWGALVASARGVNAHLGLEAGDQWLMDLPIAHVGGLGIVIRCALKGATLTIPTRSRPLAEAIEALRPTHASLVSTQLQRLLAAGADCSSLRAILLGGSAMPDGLLAEAAARSLPVSPSYGLTEMSSTVTAVGLPATREAMSTSGMPLACREVRISASGEIEVRGETRFSGYLTPEGLSKPFDASGWFATGDLGRLDAKGRLSVNGRSGLRFVSGGENVQPEAIERELLALEDVAEAIVVPVPDTEFGHRPLAWVRMASGGKPDVASLGAALRQRLPGYMVPVAFEPWGGSQGMKPNRQKLTLDAAETR